MFFLLLFVSLNNALLAINFLQKYIYFFIRRKYFFYFFVNLKKIMKLQLKKFFRNTILCPKS